MGMNDLLCFVLESTIQSLLRIGRSKTALASVLPDQDAGAHMDIQWSIAIPWMNTMQANQPINQSSKQPNKSLPNDTKLRNFNGTIHHIQQFNWAAFSLFPQQEHDFFWKLESR